MVASKSSAASESGLARPPAPVSVVDRWHRSLRWFGVARAVAVVVAVVAVGAGGFWLLRTPAAPVESRLPFAGSVPDTVASTTRSVPLGAPVSVPTTSGVPVVVHVAGAVAAPGVYRLTPGSRVVDAIAIAGGLRSDAAAGALNEAAVLRDGERVYVPLIGEPVPPLAVGSVPAAGPSSPAGPVDLNTATVDQLDALPGIGPTTAAAIVAHRDQHGPFGSVDELTDVRGIGPAKLEALREQVRT